MIFCIYFPLCSCLLFCCSIFSCVLITLIFWSLFCRCRAVGSWWITCDIQRTILSDEFFRCVCDCQSSVRNSAARSIALSIPHQSRLHSQPRTQPQSVLRSAIGNKYTVPYPIVDRKFTIVHRSIQQHVTSCPYFGYPVNLATDYIKAPI